MSVYAFILRRLIALPLLLLGVLTVAFCLVKVSNTDPLNSILSERMLNNPEAVAAAKHRWGLDKGLGIQYVTYVRNALTGDLGTSFRTKRPVMEDLLDRLPATLELVMAALLIGSLLGICAGVLSAWMRDGPIDHSVRIFALFGSSVPVFWSGLVFLWIFSVKLHILPGPGRLDARFDPGMPLTGLMTADAILKGDWKMLCDALEHLLMPAFVLGWAVMGIIARLVRGSMLDVLSQEYIDMARAKGAGRMRVMFRHALPNALIPAITVIGYSFAFLMTGAVLTETIFSWPGIGSYAVDSARTLDLPAIIGVTMLGGTVFLVTNLITDVAYAIADPKIELQ